MTKVDATNHIPLTPEIDKVFKNFLEQGAKEKAEYESTKIKCGFVGRSGVGKSSLINAIIDEKKASVGSSKETTLEAQEYVHRGLHLVDLPGCGTKSFPTSSYLEKLNLSSYDFFIFVTETRFFEDEATIFGKLTKELTKPSFLVRSKFDEAWANSQYDDPSKAEKELRQEIEQDIRKNLAPLTVERIYMISSRQPTKYDLPMLLEDIINHFSGIKRMRLENDFAAWSSEALGQKKKNALQLAAWYAGLSAVNGLNPIPLLDVAVDLSLLCKMVQDVAAIYNLTPGQKSYWERQLGGKEGIAIIQKIVALASKYGTEAAVTTVLKTLGKREASQMFKYILPFVGPLVSSGASYYLTYNFGASVVEEFHSTAEDILTHLRLPSPKT